MKALTKQIGILPLASAITLAAAGKAFAFAPGVYCYGGEANATCELQIAETLSLETTVANMLDNYDQSYQLSGTVFLVSGKTRIPMQQSDIVVDMGDEAEMYGTAVIPFDKMPGLQNATFETLPRVAVGLVQGETIPEVVGKPVPINNGISPSGTSRPDGEPYVLFHMDAGIAMSYDFGEDYELLNNFKFTMPGSVSATAIFDPVDPYIYWSYDKTEGIDLNGLKKKEDTSATEYELVDDDGNVMIRYTQNNYGELYEQNFVTGEMFIYLQDSDGNYVMEGGDPDNPIVLDGKQFDKSKGRHIPARDNSDKKEGESKADIGSFGVSLNGWIPYEAQNADAMPFEVAEFSGQLLLQGTIPMGGGVSLDGNVVTYIGEHGFSQGGNGDLIWGLPFLPDFISFDIELGAASAALEIMNDEQTTFVSGELKPEAAFLEDLLPIMPEAGAKVQGYIGNDIHNAFISIEGAMGMGADTLGDWIGVDLNSLNMTTARAEIDAYGITISGKTAMQIHPAIEINSEVNVYANMDWQTPEDVILRIVGDMNLYGVELEDVTLEISSRGMFANGAFVTPASRIAMFGSISDSGAELSGSGEVMLNLGDITGAMKAAHQALTAAQADVNKITREITSMRSTVQAEREAHQQKLNTARKAVSIAQSKVNGLKKKIAYESRMIKSRNAQIRSWYRWHKKAKWHQKASRYARYVKERAWRKADIARRYATIATYKASLAIANTALKATQSSLSAMEAATKTFPVDADPRIVGLFAAKETANLALEAAKLPFANIPYIEGDFAGKIELTLNHGGIDGTVSANFSGYSLLKGHLIFNPQFEACIDVPSFGAACTRL